MNQHNQQPDANQNWDACPTGEIQGLSHGLRAKKQQQQLQQISLIGGALAVLLAVGLWFGPDLKTQPRIACLQVKEHLQDYIDSAPTLSVELTTQIKDHLVHCKQCREEMESMRVGEIVTRPSQVYLKRTPHTDFAAKVRNIDWSRSVAFK